MRGIGNTLPLTWVITLLQDPWLGFGWATTASLIVVGVLVGSFRRVRGAIGSYRDVHR